MHCWPARSSQTSVFFSNEHFSSRLWSSSVGFNLSSHAATSPPEIKRKEIKSLLLQNKPVFFSFMVRFCFPFCHLSVVEPGVSPLRLHGSNEVMSILIKWSVCYVTNWPDLACRRGTLLRSLSAQLLGCYEVHRSTRWHFSSSISSLQLWP